MLLKIENQCALDVYTSLIKKNQSNSGVRSIIVGHFAAKTCFGVRP